MRQSADQRTLRVFIIGLLASVAVLGVAYYLQHVENLDPCPWCIVQRLGFMAIALLALIGLLHRPGPAGAVLYGTLGALIGAGGAAAAGYQIWLQNDPERATACVGSPVETFLDTVSIGDLWPNFLQYDGPCTLKPWALFGLGIPEWSLVWYVILAAMFGSLLLRPPRY